MPNPWEKYAQPQQGVMVKPADPTLEGRVIGQTLNNTGQGISNAKGAVDARVNAATESAQVREARARADKAEAEARVVHVTNVNPAAKLEEDLRSRFEALPEVRDYKSSVAALGGMMRAPDTSGGDINVIYAFIRSQGPGPVAEGELQLAQGVASFREDLERRYGKLTSSNRLPQRVRLELIEAARQSVGAKAQIYAQSYQQYRSLAEQSGVNPERVTGPYAGDSIRPYEEQYIRAHGGEPRSAYSDPSARANYDDLILGADSFGGEATTGDTKRVRDEATSHQVDRMIRAGVPYASALERVTQMGAGGLDPVAYQEAIKYQRNHPNFKGSFTLATKDVPMGMVEKGVNDFLQSPFGTGASLFADAATGGIPSFIGGEKTLYDKQVLAAKNPKPALVGEAAGSIAGMFGAGKLVKGVAPGLSAGRSMLLGDALYGGMYGASQSPEDRMRGAATGAALGVGGNVVGRYAVAPAMRAAGQTALAQSIANGIRQGAGRVTGRTIGDYAPPARPAFEDRQIFNAASDTLPQVRQDLVDAQSLGLPFSMADASPQLRSIAGSTQRLSGDLGAEAATALNRRNLGQTDRFLQNLQDNLSPFVNPDDVASGLQSRARVQSSPLYDQAFSASPVDDPLLADILRRPAGEKAIRDAYGIALNSGEKPGALSFVDGPDGPILQGTPNWRTLHYTKMGLDSAVEKARDPMTGALNLKDPALRAMNDTRAELVGRMGDVNPAYRQANEVYATNMRLRDALDRGVKTGKGNALPRDVEKAVSMLDPEQLALFRQGYATSLADKAGKLRTVSDPYRALVGSQSQRDALRTVFPEGADRFGRLADLEDQMARTGYEINGNSATASRLAADDAFKTNPLLEGAAELGGSALTGAPPTGMLFQGIGRLAKFGVGRQAQQRARVLGDVLLDQNPGAALNRLDSLVVSSNAWDDYVRRSNDIWGQTGASLAIPGYLVSQ